MKTLTFLIGLSLISSVSHAAFTLSWNNNAQQNLFDLDGSTLLTGHINNGSIGYFAQLIYAGANDVIDPLNPNSTDGVGGDDVVLGYRHVGFNMGFDPANGNINASTSGINLSQGDLIYARFFNAASSNYASGLVPTPFNGGVATHYGDTSSFYTVTAGNADNVTPVNSTWQFGSVSTTMAIPEPSTTLLIVVATGMLFGLRRKFLR